MTKKQFCCIVWENEVRRHAEEVTRRCPTLCGGRGPKETAEEYAMRGIKHIEDALLNLKWAKEQYELAKQ